VFASVTPARLGTQTGDKAPGNVSFVIKFLTGLTGRSARGRVYMCGLTETQLAGDKVTTAYGDAARTVWEELAGALGGTGFEHVVLSRYTDGVLRENALPRLITSYAITDYTVDTRRLRLRGI